MHSFRVPIVLDEDTDELVFIKDVKTGSTRNLVCYSCEQPMIPVHKDGNIPKPYFRHKNLECSANLESYIHWLSKQIFKELNYIKLPDIDFNFLYEHFWKNDEDFYKKVEGLFNRYNIPENFQDLTDFNIQLQNEKELCFDSFLKEVSSPTDLGRIQTDIVISSSEGDFFIEPFYTHKIEADTFEKIVIIDISTIAIDLNKFLKEMNFIYSKEQFKYFIKNDIESKHWVYVNSKERNNLFLRFFKELEIYIIERLDKIEKYSKIIRDKEEINNKKEPYFKKKNELRLERFSIMDKVFKIDKNIGNVDKKLLDINNDLDIKQKELELIENNFFNNSNSL